ncbi:pyridoxamine 5'-phosphate oxidase family protein [uncultured Oscillibacter sp.]|uniref:pyridoxamine 5'-phosphate oxidase family protein n=1 Tax=uncultured Oscillibacter sp. TaxID=876091 RepID=UPI0025FF5769|nr:pyridoxamine 5'-phosphate oxidase family protein [uncultured Oscillibacter sp.]
MLRNPEETVGGMADRAKRVYLSYLDDEGFPTTRAMLAPRERTGIRTFWLTTNTSSRKVAAFRKDPRAGLYLVDTRFFRGVSLSGTVEVLETAEARARIWREGDTMYYPLGVTDPDYCVLKFTARRGRYYSNFQSVDFEIGGEGEHSQP